jgi:hypothetical protein
MNLDQFFSRVSRFTIGRSTLKISSGKSAGSYRSRHAAIFGHDSPSFLIFGFLP